MRREQGKVLPLHGFRQFTAGMREAVAGNDKPETQRKGTKKHGRKAETIKA
jgi:hypothetical protein